MKVKVERCIGEKFRLTLPNGDREIVRGELWDRKTASKALDVLEYVYGFARRAVRFVH